MITIKKYRNRRLYDTSESRYVNLVDVAEMIRKGEELEILDVTSGEDITRVVLTQIIMEGAKDDEQGMPVEFLRQLIASSGRAQHELMTRYVSFLTGMYQRAQTEIRDRMRTPEPGASTNPLNPLEAFQRFMQPGAFEGIWNTPAPSDDAPASPPAGTAEELELMRRKIDELEKLLHQSAADATSDPAAIKTESDT